MCVSRSPAVCPSPCICMGLCLYVLSPKSHLLNCRYTGSFFTPRTSLLLHVPERSHPVGQGFLVHSLLPPEAPCALRLFRGQLPLIELRLLGPPQAILFHAPHGCAQQSLSIVFPRAPCTRSFRSKAAAVANLKSTWAGKTPEMHKILIAAEVPPCVI